MDTVQFFVEHKFFVELKFFVKHIFSQRKFFLLAEHERFAEIKK